MDVFTDYNPVGGNALIDFSFDQSVEIVSGFEDAWLIMGLCEVAEVFLIG